MKYLIIGASAAGLAAAESIRKYDTEGSVTILTEEDYLPYSRPSISYYLKGKVKESNMALRKPAFYKQNNIAVVTGAKVTSVDRQSQTVKAGRKTYSYDRLCLATALVFSFAIFFISLTADKSRKVKAFALPLTFSIGGTKGTEPVARQSLS